MDYYEFLAWCVRINLVMFVADFIYEECKIIGKAIAGYTGKD